MSQEDDAIIQAVTDRLMKAPFMGGNAFHCRLAAKTVIEAYLGSLEAMGWAVVPKEWTRPMWDAWEESEGGGEDEFLHVIAASPKAPGLGD